MTVEAYESVFLDRLLATASVRPGDPAASWATADPYLLDHAIEHAAAAGRRDELLTDPEFLVHANPVTLMAHLDAATTDEALLYAAIYRTSAHLHHNASPGLCRELLALDAARYGRPGMISAPTADRPHGPRWWPAWSTGGQVGSAHRSTIDTTAGAVDAVACTMVEGRPVAVTGSADGSVRVWDLTTGTPHGQPLTGHTGPVFAVACTTLNDRPIAITASRDATARVWDLTTGTPHGQPLTGHTDWVQAVACTTLNDRPIAITGSRDDTVRVWDLGTAREIYRSRLPTSVSALAVTTSGGLVVGFGWEVAHLRLLS